MRKKGKSICIFSPKGGTGKTILAMNLAGIASLSFKKTLLIDLDLYNGGLSMLINKNIEKTIFHLVDDLNNNRYKNFEDYIYKYNDNINILCSPRDPRQGSKVTSNFLDMIFNRAVEIYDLVIVDMSCILNDTNIVTMDMMDEILFILTPDIVNLKNLKNLLTIFKDNSIDNYNILLNNSICLKSMISINAMEKVINSKINYVISNDFYMYDINDYIFDSKIPILYKTNIRKYKRDAKTLENILDTLYEEEEIDEKE